MCNYFTISQFGTFKITKSKSLRLPTYFYKRKGNVLAIFTQAWNSYKHRWKISSVNKWCACRGTFKIKGRKTMGEEAQRDGKNRWKSVAGKCKKEGQAKAEEAETAQDEILSKHDAQVAACWPNLRRKWTRCLRFIKLRGHFPRQRISNFCSSTLLTKITSLFAR